MGLELYPISFKEACEFVKTHHRHLRPPQGHKFSISCVKAGDVVGVCMVGRPVARHLDNGLTFEIRRVATDGTKNACSFLYSASWRIARNLGYKKLITSILSSETGRSLYAADFKCVGEAGGGNWYSAKRPRSTDLPNQKKIKFERTIS